jgi:hypothetical protein
MRTIGIFTMTVCFILGSGAQALAYIDPGSGGMLYQVAILAIGAFLGYLAFLKDRIKGIFLGKRKKPDPEDKQV